MVADKDLLYYKVLCSTVGVHDAVQYVYQLSHVNKLLISVNCTVSSRQLQ